ncbi:DegT/DnrJ/EryC1/StrS family aminotransferase [Methanobrevibacter curvatus]|nr:DegT/DnrJ/EryC1/StrS family aminotransferase [Methanobrevibacter curvatus]
MDLFYKKRSNESKLDLLEVIEYDGFNFNEKEYFKSAEDHISSLTGHNHAKLTNSGNSAILIAMNNLSGPIFIPDQGAWHGFKQIAKFLKKEIVSIKTNQGLINLDDLEDSFHKYSSIVSYSSGFFLTSFAGYTAEQDIKEIAKICDENEVTLVEDVSGGIGDDKKHLANGRYSDIIVCSSGSPKIVNFGYGGFISSNDENIFSNSKLLLNTFKVSPIIARGIDTELNNAKKNFTKAVTATRYLKKSFSNVIHHDKRGINLIVSNDNPNYLFKILNEDLKTVEGKSILTKCPNYNRIKEKALAIEIKNLDANSLNKENLDEIINICENVF